MQPVGIFLPKTRSGLCWKACAARFTPEDVRAFSGHSLRVGAAQDLLCAGFDTAAIMRAGGWKSINVLGRYLEFAEHNVWG